MMARAMLMLMFSVFNLSHSTAPPSRVYAYSITFCDFAHMHNWARLSFPFSSQNTFTHTQHSVQFGILCTRSSPRHHDTKLKYKLAQGNSTSAAMRKLAFSIYINKSLALPPGIMFAHPFCSRANKITPEKRAII